MKKPKHKKKIHCENCGEELSDEEIQYGGGWCFRCNLDNYIDKSRKTP